MIILKEKVAGYNNTLTLATKEMKFGINEEVNKVVPLSGSMNENSKVPESGTFGKGGDSPPFETTTTQRVVNSHPSVIPEADETIYLLGTVVTLVFVVARYVI